MQLNKVREKKQKLLWEQWKMNCISKNERQKHIFYGSGRPIYGVSLETQHLRKSRDNHDYGNNPLWDYNTRKMWYS